MRASPLEASISPSCILVFGSQQSPSYKAAQQHTYTNINTLSAQVRVMAMAARR